MMLSLGEYAMPNISNCPHISSERKLWWCLIQDWQVTVPGKLGIIPRKRVKIFHSRTSKETSMLAFNLFDRYGRLRSEFEPTLSLKELVFEAKNWIKEIYCSLNRSALIARMVMDIVARLLVRYRINGFIRYQLRIGYRYAIY